MKTESRSISKAGLALIEKTRFPGREEFRWSGLTLSVSGIEVLLEDVTKKYAVFLYKKNIDFVWVMFMGGTGTGKSTLFNALVGDTVSKTGIERPKTSGPLAYVYRKTALGEQFPFADLVMVRMDAEQSDRDGHAGVLGQMLVLQHDRRDLSHVVFVDTPDVDSLELKNRQMVEDLSLLADVVVYVTSQEKYADEVPLQFLLRVKQSEKPCFVIVNKAEEELITEDVLKPIHLLGMDVDPAQLWRFPLLPGNPTVAVSGCSAMAGFRSALDRAVGPSETPKLVLAGKDRASEELRLALAKLLDALVEEERASKAWLEQLDVFYQWSCQHLLNQLEEHFLQESRAPLQQEIRKHFSKYDLLGKPRRFLSQVVQMPLRAIGLMGEPVDGFSQETLYQLFQKTDFQAIVAEIERFNRTVLEQLPTAQRNSEFALRLRDSSLALTAEEVRDATSGQFNGMVIWLEEVFQALSSGIPRSKELGIYSTSILWGGLILALEVAVGGGISILQAVVDSAIAPFVTRGAVELFAVRELQTIAKELGRRYQQAVLTALEGQRQRYRNCMMTSMIPDHEIDAVRTALRELTGTGH